jgi:signal transduction histidine kinase
LNRLAEIWRETDQRSLDRLLAFVMGLVMVASVIGATVRQGSIAANLLIGLPSVCLALLWRRERPVEALGVIAIGSIALTALLTPSFHFPPATITLIICSYSVGVHTDGRRAQAGVAISVLTIGGICAAVTPKDILFPVLVFGLAPWCVGRVLREHTSLTRDLADKETRLRHMRELDRQSAVIAERSRVARELHDVLAHNLSVMVIQASVARRTHAANPQIAIEAADLIERTGREALVELRHVFGPVRRGEGEALEGSPGLAQLDGLVERARGAGLPVSLRIEGDRVELAPGADMAAYRLIQEALTNTLKHAGTPTTEIVLGYRHGGVSIEIVDDGDAVAPDPSEVDSGGNGLIGMRERVNLYGGEMEAGPRSEGGYAVRARLPLEADRERVAV